MNEGDFGRAEQLSKARNTSVEGLGRAGIIGQRPGKVWLVAREDLPADWDPAADDRMTVWEITQHLIRRLEHDGEQAAASLLRKVGSGLGETAKELAYRLYLVCDRKGWAKEATSYNALVTAWPELTRLAALEPARPVDASGGATLFEE
jgi:putative DNA methylase